MSLICVVVLVIDVKLESVANTVVVEGGAVKLSEKTIWLINHLVHKCLISYLLLLNDYYEVRNI